MEARSALSAPSILLHWLKVNSGTLELCHCGFICKLTPMMAGLSSGQLVNMSGYCVNLLANSHWPMHCGYWSWTCQWLWRISFVRVFYSTTDEIRWYLLAADDKRKLTPRLMAGLTSGQAGNIFGQLRQARNMRQTCCGHVNHYKLQFPTKQLKLHFFVITFNQFWMNLR